jgi:hypothetical protein
VLRPGGRLALAAWDGPEHNAWQTVFGTVLVELGFTPAPDPELPSMFSFAAPGRIEQLLDAAGFLEWRVDAVDFEFHSPSFDDWWEHNYDLSQPLVTALAALTPAQRDEVYETVEERVAPNRLADGSLRFPARTLVALATA